MTKIPVTVEVDREDWLNGRPVEVVNPDPRPETTWVMQYVASGRSRQEWHNNTVEARTALDAMQRWIARSRDLGGVLIRDIHRLGGGLIVACPLLNDGSYTMRTDDMVFGRVDPYGNVTEGC